MGKRAAGEVSQKILEVLSSHAGRSMSIQDIAKEAGVSYDSVKRHVEVFVKIDVLRRLEENGKVVYQKMRSYKSDTLFSIPLSAESKERIKKVYATVLKVWPSICDKPLSKTLMQKIAVDVIEELHPEVPRGWYLYGEILMLPFDSDQDYGPPIDETPKVGYIRGVCKEYCGCCDASYKIRRHQYEKKKKPLYLVKEDLSYYLTYFDYNDPKNKNKIREALNNFIFNLERKEFNSWIIALVDDFCSSVLQILRHGSVDEINQSKPIVIENFNNVWQLVATYELYDSLTRFFDKELLKDYFFERLNELKETCLESMDSLYEALPKYELPDDEIGRKLKVLQGSARELSPEEKKAGIAELTRKEKELGHKRFQEWLFEQVGLK
ncbi:MAG: hypothetical protein AABX47_01505 [Nanoarchaeota archaeon]